MVISRKKGVGSNHHDGHNEVVTLVSTVTNWWW